MTDEPEQTEVPLDRSAMIVITFDPIRASAAEAQMKHIEAFAGELVKSTGKLVVWVERGMDIAAWDDEHLAQLGLQRIPERWQGDTLLPPG